MNWNQEAIETYAELITRKKIDCAFIRTQSYVYSTRASQPLELEAAAAQQLHLPVRFHLSASAQNLSTDTVQAFKGLVLETLHLPDETVSALPPGHGGIIDWNGRKAGVYKDEAGEVFAVHPRCPYLGCALRWNPDEKNWDCPCHGSRFGYDGTLLTGPAQRPLARMTD